MKYVIAARENTYYTNQKFIYASGIEEDSYAGAEEHLRHILLTLTQYTNYSKYKIYEVVLKEVE